MQHGILTNVLQRNTTKNKWECSEILTIPCYNNILDFVSISSFVLQYNTGVSSAVYASYKD